MQKVRVLRSFHDVASGGRVRPGKTLEVSEQRAADLARNGLVEPVKEAAPKTEAPKPKTDAPKTGTKAAAK